MQRAPIGALCISSCRGSMACFYSAPLAWNPTAVDTLSGFDGLWKSLFPAEQARIARLLIERVTVSAEGMAVDLRTEGLGSVIRQMVTPKQELAA